ncbi:MAG: PA4780 family RIO1-like protein kinase [Polyangiales bacterium]
MQTPASLVSLVDEGIVEQVLRPLMSGKEAQVYLVRSEGELRVAKVYKEAGQRSFRQRAEYAEGRTVRNSRDQRAMAKRTRHGREQDEAAWRSAEVETIYRLRAAGVRVPVPYHFVDGVLIMELVVDAHGNPAPRLGELSFDRASATEVYERVLAEVVAMLAAGVVHGDLSDFNILMGVDGPVLIDFPQAVNASSNRNARSLLLRDVDNLHRFLGRFVPGRKAPPYAQEMWQLYECGELAPDTKLTGRFRPNNALALTDDVLALIAEAERDERRRRQATGKPMPGSAKPAPSGPRARPPQGHKETPAGPQHAPSGRGRPPAKTDAPRPDAARADASPGAQPSRRKPRWRRRRSAATVPGGR